MTPDPTPFDGAPPAPAPEPAREPFWGYGDLAMLVGLGAPAMAIASTMAALAISHFTKVKVASLLPAQFLGYAVLFAVVWFLFRTHYERPLWESLGWRRYDGSRLRVVLLGVATALAVVLSAAALRVQDAPNPMKELLNSRGAVVLVTIFGTTIGPICEELVFRGFLQPLLVRSIGVAGIAAAALPFGLLHLPQYGWSWRHALLVTMAGCAFGWMRHTTGSTRASSLMHAAYNGFFFGAFLSQWRNITNTW
jgi:membrane protease YdiL (CAAX protease family)